MGGTSNAPRHMSGHLHESAHACSIYHPPQDLAFAPQPSSPPTPAPRSRFYPLSPAKKITSLTVGVEFVEANGYCGGHKVDRGHKGCVGTSFDLDTLLCQYSDV